MVITWQQLRDAREYADLTQTELAEQLKVSPRTIVNWESENGSGVPRKSEYKVERLLGSAMRIAEHLRLMPPIEDNEVTYRVPGPDGVDQIVSSEEYAEYEQEMASSQQAIPDVTANAHRRRRGALAVFTDMDLANELRDRAAQRGIKESDWSARGVASRSVVPNLHNMEIDEERYAADSNNSGPDEDLRQP